MHIHLFYLEQTDTLLDKLKSIGDNPYDLFITMCRHDDAVEQKIKSFNPAAKIIMTHNVGADVYPFIHILNSVDLDDYSYIVKLHTRRDLTNHYFCGEYMYGISRRKYLLNFISSQTGFQKCLDTLNADEKLGMIADYQGIVSKPRRRDKETIAQALDLLQKHGLSCKVRYVSGTIFMARAKLFRIVQELRLSESDFSKYTSGSGGMLPHIMEVFFGASIIAHGYEIRDVFTPFMRKLCYLVLKKAVRVVRFFYRNDISVAGYRTIKILKITIPFATKHENAGEVADTE
ncbi:hypothetical protein SAMD00024442_41_28 [Candidatus Symbiothrix dinenymphae]|nr:hypothetical protein SAMD00024442_41_28 [Candidatus Symbiothrix dinenymphae]